MDKEEPQQLNIGNCPHCTKIIFKNGAFASNASFTMRCPSCQKLLEIEIRTKIEIIIKPVERYVSEKKPKFGKLPIAFLSFTHMPTLGCLLCTVCVECAGCLANCMTVIC
jgi:phage FluMu protein Com